MPQRPFQQTGCGQCSYPSGHIGACVCKTACGDEMCGAAPLPPEDYAPPPVPAFR